MLLTTAPSVSYAFVKIYKNFGQNLAISKYTKFDLDFCAKCRKVKCGALTIKTILGVSRESAAVLGKNSLLQLTEIWFHFLAIENCCPTMAATKDAENRQAAANYVYIQIIISLLVISFSISFLILLYHIVAALSSHFWDFSVLHKKSRFWLLFLCRLPIFKIRGICCASKLG